jgi:uncharacterized membrane protein YcjF (UPF0283 family)
LSQTTTNDYEESYEKLQSLESNRLTISSFLGGLTFAAFAAFESSPIKISFASFSVQEVFGLGAAICLGISTLIFLAVAVSAYQALRHLSQISQESVKKMQVERNSNGNVPRAILSESAPTDSDLARDFRKIGLALRIHNEAEKAINLGFGFLIFALFFVGLEVNYSVGIIVILSFFLVAYYFRTVRNMLTHWLKLKVSRKK